MATSKTVLITGASTGIGRATAELFERNGWQVVATMRSARIRGDNKAPAFPRTYQAAMKAVNARKTMLMRFEMAERGQPSD